jgi:hypothetical protein
MNAEYNGSCSLSVGNSTLPYFLTGLLSVIGLLSCGTLLYFNDNTVQRGLKHIDLFIPVYTTPTFYLIVVGTMFGVFSIIGFEKIDIICTSPFLSLHLFLPVSLCPCVPLLSVSYSLTPTAVTIKNILIEARSLPLSSNNKHIRHFFSLLLLPSFIFTSSII